MQFNINYKYVYDIYVVLYSIHMYVMKQYYGRHTNV